MHDIEQGMKFTDPGQSLQDSKLISVYFRAASIKNAYKREVYGVFDYLGDIGGISSIISLLAIFVTSGLVKRLYYAAIIGNTYRIQHYDQDFTQYYPSRL